MPAGKPNARLDQSEMAATRRLSAQDRALLERAIDTQQLSTRAMHRIVRVARTIADLDDSADILSHPLADAIGLRGSNRIAGATVSWRAYDA
jgi:magnesium chelatase family protein